MAPAYTSDQDRWHAAATLLRDAERTVRVLRTIDWPPEIAEEFFAKGADRLPEVAYPPFDEAPVRSGVAGARALLLSDHPVDAWLLRAADAIETGGAMLAGAGTPVFTQHARTLYGDPCVPLPDGISTSLGLARRICDALGGIDVASLVPGGPPTHDADVLAEHLRTRVARHFGDAAPLVEVVDHLSAKALAGARRIKIRRGASFSDLDLRQLTEHEAYVHIGTSLNGKAQEALPLLGAGHPGTTRTQEGLAVFAEFISGSLDPERFRRLADRIIAIQMCLDGADFLELHRHFLERGQSPGDAFENARRVVRGGTVVGGAPFTKDGVYLDGLLRVHNFLRVAIQLDRSDCVELLFSGKLDIEDLPALAELSHAGLCRPPRFLPPWARDRRFLLTYLTYSSFLNSIHLAQIRDHYAEMLRAAPRARPSPAPERVG